MNRIQSVTIRLNDIERQTLRENADAEHISVSEYVRNLIKEKKIIGGTTTPPLESIINNQAHIMWSTETTNGNNT